jgi:hypothetical protein
VILGVIYWPSLATPTLRGWTTEMPGYLAKSQSLSMSRDVVPRTFAQPVLVLCHSPCPIQPVGPLHAARVSST